MSITMGVFLIYGIVLTFCVSWSVGFFLSTNELPCEFEDSVNITDGRYLPDGSILHNGIKYTKQQYDTVHYRLVNNVKRVKIDAHLRGCPCNVKPCLRLCCPLGSFVNITEIKRGTILQEIPCYQHEAARNFQKEVFDENTHQSHVEILDNYFSYALLLEPTKFYKIFDFQITNDGHVNYKNRSHNHRDYCLRAIFNQTSHTIELGVFAFFDTFEKLPTKYILSAVCMLISVFFIAATIFVYIFLPELHNLHGSCLVCHLAGLIVAYTLTAWVKLNGWHYVDPNLCYFRGHLMYFALISAFLWSNVISYDLWRNFRATLKLRQFSDKDQFRLYMVYGWGVSAILTIVLPILDYSQPFPDYMPGIDFNTCFLRNESLWLYFYAPLFIIFGINVVCFTLTTLKICQIQRDLVKMTSDEESARHQSDLNNGKDDLMLYVRLFVITGATWFLEGISFVISPESNGNVFLIIIDIWTALQGLIIFVSYIMKRRVLILIQKRYQALFGKVAARESFALHSSSSSKSINVRFSLASYDKSKYKEVR